MTMEMTTEEVEEARLPLPTIETDIDCTNCGYSYCNLCAYYQKCCMCNEKLLYKVKIEVVKYLAKIPHRLLINKTIPKNF